jgi:hypothetical protein
MGFETRTFENPVESCGPILLATRAEDPSLPAALYGDLGDPPVPPAAEFSRRRCHRATLGGGIAPFARGRTQFAVDL